MKKAERPKRRIKLRPEQSRVCHFVAFPYVHLTTKSRRDIVSCGSSYWEFIVRSTNRTLLHLSLECYKTVTKLNNNTSKKSIQVKNHYKQNKTKEVIIFRKVQCNNSEN